MPKRPLKPTHKVPKLPPHWHPAGCACTLGVAYLRVSKVGDRTKLISPDLQLDAIVAYAKAHNVRLIDIVSDIDRSGRTFRKRSVDKIIKEIAQGRYTRVLLWKWSRWARNVAESTFYLAKVRDAGGRVDSATEDVDQETAMGRLQMDMVMRFDQYVSEVMAETWDAVHKKRRESGLPHGGRPRFGYDYVKRKVMVDGDEVEQCSYVANVEQAAAVKTAYTEYAKKKTSFQVIAMDLNAAGFRTTLKGRWTAQAVQRMMDTGFAAGYIRERSKPDGKPANRMSDYDIWRTGGHAPIIDEDTWLTYKGHRASQREVPARSKRAVHGLSALLFCGLCGRRMITKYAGTARTHQWQCLWQKSFHPGQPVSVNNRLALKAVHDWVRKVAGDGEDVDRRARAEFGRLKTGAGPDRIAIAEDIKRWQKKLTRLVDLYTDEVVDKPTYLERKAAYEAEVRKLMAERDAAKASEPNRPDYRAFRSLDEEWEELDPPVMRDALGALVGGIVVSPRLATSTRASASDRVDPIGRWEAERLSRIQRSA